MGLSSFKTVLKWSFCCVSGCSLWDHAAQNCVGIDMRGQGQGWGPFFFQPKNKKDKTAFQKKETTNENSRSEESKKETTNETSRNEESLFFQY